MRKQTDISSGLSLELKNESTSNSLKAASSITNFLSRVIIVFTLSAGGIFTFSSMMNIPQIEWINYIIIAVCTVILTCIYKAVKKHWLVLLISFAAVLVAGLFMLTPVVTGFKLLYDSAVKSIYDAMYWTAPDPLIVWDDSYISNTTYCMAMVSVFITSLIAYFSVAKTHFIGAFLVTFPLFEFGAAFGCVSDKASFALLLAGWAAMLSLHISNRQKNEVKHRNCDKINNHKQYVYKNKTQRFGGSAIVMATSVFLCFVIILSAITSSGFARSESLDELRKNVKYGVLNIYDLITEYDHDASLKEGDLKVLGDRKVLGRDYATLRLPSTKRSIYLKGYVGSIYTGDSWEGFDEDTYEQIEKVKKILAKQEYSLATITGDLLYRDYGDKNLKLGEFSISDFRREKEYAYAPSGVVSSVSMMGYEDLYAKPEYTDSYSYKAYYDEVDYLVIPYTSYYQDKEFAAAWAEYTSFVQSNYTLLPEGIDEVAKLGQELKGDTVYTTVDNVRAFLATNTKYSDFVQKLPEGKDFAEYFLFEKGTGYSAHYATAAAVMLRALGVPTRYIEGFYVPKEQIADAQGDERQKTVTLTDGNSHAWIEIFDADYGWIPVDVTNGYYSGSFAATMKKAQDKADKFNDEPEEVEKAVQNNDNSDSQVDIEEAIEENQDDAQDDEQLNYVENKTLLHITIAFCVLIAIAIIFAVAMIVRRNAVLSKRKKIFQSSNYRGQVILGFELLRKMLKFKKINIDSAYKFDDFKKIVNENSEIEVEDEVSIDEIFNIYQKAMFSKLLISEEDAEKVLDFIDEYGYGLYQYLTVANRLKWGFIDLIS